MSSPKLVRKNKYSPKINSLFAEQLFQQWVSGQSLKTIHELYQNTPQAFHYQTLKDVKAKYNWEKRRQEILAEIHEQTSEQIKLSCSRQLQALQCILDMHIDEIQKTFADYKTNPEEFLQNMKKKRLSWLPKNSKDLAYLMMTFNRLAQDNQNELNKDIRSRTSSFPEFSEEQSNKIYEILREAATNKALGKK